jgi:ribosomal-protein-serine acetyltransferase
MQATFDTESIGIRPFCGDDVPLLYGAVRESLDELCAWTTWCRPDFGLEHARTFILKCTQDWGACEGYNFAIVDLKDDTFLGCVGLGYVCPRHNFANVDYWVRRDWTGRGVATSATRLIAVFGLKELRFGRLEILVSVENMASRRVAEKAGAKFEGVLRKRLLLAGKSHDAAAYSLVAADLLFSSNLASAGTDVRL